MAKIRAGDTILLRGEVTRADDDDGTITVLIDGIIPIRHTLRADSSAIEASASPGGRSGKARRNAVTA